MVKILNILGLSLVIMTLLFSVLPLSNLAFIPGVCAFICGGISVYFSKKSGAPRKIIHYIFLLTFMSLLLATYKLVFNESKVLNTHELLEKAKESEQDAIDELEELDIDVDDINVD